jgi:hypothetical protein
LLLLIKRILFLAETDDFSPGLLLRYLGLFFLILKYFPFCFKGFLFENLGYSINLADIAGLALTNILGISSMFHITRSNALSPVVFTTSTRSYVSFTSFSYRVIKGNRTTIVAFGWYNRKKRRSWLSSNISYMILKRRDDANREGNSITNTHVTRRP